MSSDALRRLVPAVAVALGATLGGCGAQEARPSAASIAALDAATHGAEAAGGRGATLPVTTLAPWGPGSLREALATPGPRTVVFEVGGVIDLAGESITVEEPFLTIAGETAPPPGITLVRGGLRLETHDVVVRHLRIRPGEAGHAKGSGWEVDALTAAGPQAHDILVEHCSLSWATDENFAATGPRFSGATLDEWRLGTARRVTFRSNIVAEGLSHSTHGAGEHSKGALIHDNVTEVALVGNLFAHNRQRNPLFKGGASGAVVNNLIYGPGEKAVHYALRADEWDGHAHATGRLAVIGNVLKLGPDSAADLPLVRIEGEGPVELRLEDNLVLDRLGRLVEAPTLVRDPGGLRRPASDDADLPPALPAAHVLELVLREAGARPWDRDAVDSRLVQQVRDGSGRLIDSEADVGG